MIFLILDVFYQDQPEQTLAQVAGIRFMGVEQHAILNTYQTCVTPVAPYQSGEFYKREMPCLLALIEQITEPFDVIIIDGFVFLDSEQKAGLGKHLYDNLTDKKPVIGIAKHAFFGIDERHAVYRGTSKHPLYVTACEFPVTAAKDLVKNLQGHFRLPDIVKQVDALSRTPINQK